MEVSCYRALNTDNQNQEIRAEIIFTEKVYFQAYFKNKCQKSEISKFVTFFCVFTSCFQGNIKLTIQVNNVSLRATRMHQGTVSNGKNKSSLFHRIFCVGDEPRQETSEGEQEEIGRRTDD